MPEVAFVVVLKCVSGIVHQCEALQRAGLGGKNRRAPIVESWIKLVVSCSWYHCD